MCSSTAVIQNNGDMLRFVMSSGKYETKRSSFVIISYLFHKHRTITPGKTGGRRRYFTTFVTASREAAGKCGNDQLKPAQEHKHAGIVLHKTLALLSHGKRTPLKLFPHIHARQGAWRLRSGSGDRRIRPGLPRWKPAMQPLLV